jgi:NADH-quinone oxidoreductase subunit L
MKTTFIVFVIGGLGLAGVPFFAGFWSKDEILTEAFEKNIGVFVLLLIAAGITAFYVFRQLYLVFAGEQRSHAYHPHESPRIMTGPLITLAVFVTIGGLLNAPPFNLLTRFLQGEEVHFALGIAGASVALAALGWLGAWALYGRQPLAAGQTDPLQKLLGPAYALIEQKYYVDELYDFLIVRPYRHLSNVAAFVIDEHFLHDFIHDKVLIRAYDSMMRFVAGPIDRDLIDHGIERIAIGLQELSLRTRKVQNGYVRQYFLIFVFGVTLILGYLIIRSR